MTTEAKSVIDNIRKKKLEEGLQGRRWILVNDSIPVAHTDLQDAIMALKGAKELRADLSYISIRNIITHTEYTVEEFLKEFDHS